MGRPEKERSCRGHPTHKQSNGVCPHCLRDRLSSFSSSSSSSTINGDGDSSSDSSTAYSSYDSELSSSTASPASERRSSTEIFRKSKSFASAEEGERGKRRLWRIWGKITVAGGGRRKERGEGLPHSKTIKEKRSSGWSFFS